MYTISVMPESDVHFGECIEDGFYVEGKSHMEVQEKLEQHEMELEKEKEEQAKWGFNQKRIDKFVKSTDNWHPCFDGDKVKVSLFLSYMPNMGFHFVRVMVWGEDDFGMNIDYENEDYDVLLEKYDEFKTMFYDKITDGINKDILREEGFEIF